MNAIDVLFAVVLLLTVFEGGAIILLVFLREQDRAKARELTALVVTLADEFKAQTGIHVEVDRNLLEEKPDVYVATPGRGEAEVSVDVVPSIGPWRPTP